MLRIQTIQTAQVAEIDGGERHAAPEDEIIRDFRDPLLELVRLLREASEIEHARLREVATAFDTRPFPTE